MADARTGRVDPFARRRLKSNRIPHRSRTDLNDRELHRVKQKPAGGPKTAAGQLSEISPACGVVRAGTGRHRAPGTAQAGPAVTQGSQQGSLQIGTLRQTIFGTIARELRKYNVTLLVVDQRPSGIDEEVMSQIGTRVTALLDNDRDINAVLTGINGAQSLREVLARLDTKQQAIIMGHAVPMPVVVKTRTYDEAFYQAIMQDRVSTSSARSKLGTGGKERRLR